MIPLRDVIPSRTRPWVTITLIVINVAVFLYEFALPKDAAQTLVNEFGLKWYAFSPGDVVTSMFLHSSLLHLVANMLCLWVFGDNVEDQMGHDRFIVFYLLAGSTASLAQMALVHHTDQLPMIGASGAIAGVMGAYLFMFPRSEVHTFVVFTVVDFPAAVYLPLWFLSQLLGVVDTHQIVGEYDPHVAYWAHIGGFLIGIVGVWLFRRPERAAVEWWDAAAR